MNKQTAVEWLWEQIDGIIPYQDMNTNQRFIGVLEQAKAMEKEQIVTAFNIGDYRADIDKDGHEYYNKTYKGGNNE